ASSWVAGSAQNSKNFTISISGVSPIGVIIFSSCSRSSASTWISTSSYRFSSMVRFLVFRRFLQQLVQSLSDQLLELLPDLRLFEGRHRLVQFPLQIGDGHRQRLVIEQLVVAAGVLDDRRTLLIFGTHGITEGAVDDTGKIIHIVKTEPGGRAK